MIYIINDKYYINIAPSIYVEVVVLENGTIKPTKNKIETNSNFVARTTSINDILKNNKVHEQPREEVRVQTQTQKHNRRKR